MHEQQLSGLEALEMTTRLLGHLYRSVGFEPCTTNDLLSGPTSI